MCWKIQCLPYAGFLNQPILCISWFSGHIRIIFRCTEFDWKREEKLIERHPFPIFWNEREKNRIALMLNLPFCPLEDLNDQITVETDWSLHMTEQFADNLMPLGTPWKSTREFLICTYILSWLELGVGVR